MKNIGIVCEYNPFHNGHAHQLAEVGKQGKAVCLMSGSYVQRGEPAVVDKMLRAEAAVRCGADLVLELPVTYSLRSAEGFAEGAVEIFDRMGCMDALCFGSEEGHIEPIANSAKLLLSDDFLPHLKEELKKGISFPAARQRALIRMGGKEDILERPNDILAVEYCKAILRSGSRIQPMVLHRPGNYHHSEDPSAPSASVLRSKPSWEGFVPDEALALFREGQRHYTASGERAMLARLRTLTETEFAELPFGTEGLWCKLYKACRTQTSLEDILKMTKSKRYTHTRLMRMLLCAFIGISASDVAEPVPYIRVLAMNEQGGKLLREIRRHGKIDLKNVGQKAETCTYAEIERRAEALYGLFAERNIEPSERKETVFYHQQ